MLRDTLNVDTFGTQLSNLRINKGFSQSAVAIAAGISTGYYRSIESDKRLPPPASTLVRILKALGCNDTEVGTLQNMAAAERRISTFEADLPEPVQALINELRARGHKLPNRFVEALRADVREASDKSQN